MTVLGVVLAAGAGERFRASGAPGAKQLAVVDGEPLVQRAVATALAARLDEVVVVSGAVDLTALGLPVAVLENPRWAEGIATSLQAGVRHA
ncbi:MAG: NTP transferase domain-containing protein, partial [Acidimicrobiales bacterium]